MNINSDRSSLAIAIGISDFHIKLQPDHIIRIRCIRMINTRKLRIGIFTVITDCQCEDCLTTGNTFVTVHGRIHSDVITT